MEFDVPENSYLLLLYDLYFAKCCKTARLSFGGTFSPAKNRWYKKFIILPGIFTAKRKNNFIMKR